MDSTIDRRSNKLTATKQKKSRDGCSCCKKKRVKCDEKRPACSRCTRLGLTCPGYGRSLKWSTKYEKLMNIDAIHEQELVEPYHRPAGAPPDSAMKEAETLTKSELLIQALEKYGPDEDAYTWLFDSAESPPHSVILELSPEETDIPQDQIQTYMETSMGSLDNFEMLNWGVSMGDTGDTSEMRTPPMVDFEYATKFDATKVNLSTVREDETDIVKATARTVCPARLTNHSRDYTGSTQHAYAVDLDYLSKASTEGVTVSQSHKTTFYPMRAILHDPGSALATYYFKEVAGIYSCFDGPLNPFTTTIARLWHNSKLLSCTIQSMAAACLSDTTPQLRILANELRTESIAVLELSLSTATLDYTTMLAIFMLGQTASWHDPNDLGTDIWKTARKLLSHVPDGKLSKTSLSTENAQFFRQAMLYWDMLLAFVTSHQMDALEVSLGPNENIMPYTVPHPWTGIARTVLHVTGKVGMLIYRKRKHARANIEDPLRDEASTTLAKHFALELLAFEPPEAVHIADPRDADTPVHHLIVIAEAYRCTGLLQLIRVFGSSLADLQDRIDVLFASIASNSTSYESPDRRQHYDEASDYRLRKYTLSVLSLLESIPIESRTRCVQPFLFVALSSELGLPAPSSVADTAYQALDVLRARKFVSSRMSMFQHLLPPRPARQKWALILEIWARLDMKENSQVYWIDVMMDKGWETVMG